MTIYLYKKNEITKAFLVLKKDFVWVILFSLIANLLMLAPTVYMLQIFDRIFVSGNKLSLLFLTVILIIFLCVLSFSEFLRSRLLIKVGSKFDMLLTEKVFKAAFKNQLKNDQKNPTEAFTNLTNIRQFLSGSGILAFLDLPWTPIYIVALYLLHPILGITSLVFALIQLALTFFSHSRFYEHTLFVTQSEQTSRDFLLNKIKNAESVESMGMLNNLKKVWFPMVNQQQLAIDRLNNIQFTQQSFTKFVRYLMQCLALAIGAVLVLRGEMSIGSMVASNVLIGRALQPIDLIVGSWKGLILAKESYRNLSEILELNFSDSNNNNSSKIRGEVLIKNLFAYSNTSSNPILNNINLHLEPGSVVALLGPSGSGKTTLARCMLGIWPNTSGQVLIDNIPIESYSKENLGSQIGYLPQGIELFDGTLAENIGRFNEADSANIVHAAKLAGVHEMILKLPSGYDTSAGEAGNLLSGGQKQRIGLARALYGNPSLIVLDEPNSNLDELGEISLLQAILELKKMGKTIFIITHRQNILNAVDYLITLKAGSVQFSGIKNDVIEMINQSTKPA